MLIVLLTIAAGGVPILENPGSTLLNMHPRFAHLVNLLKEKGLGTWIVLGNFSFSTLPEGFMALIVIHLFCWFPELEVNLFLPNLFLVIALPMMYVFSSKSLWESFSLAGPEDSTGKHFGWSTLVIHVSSGHWHGQHLGLSMSLIWDPYGRPLVTTTVKYIDGTGSTRYKGAGSALKNTQFLVSNSSSYIFQNWRAVSHLTNSYTTKA